jgi:hypothetical protein
MSPLLAAASEIQTYLQAERLAFCFIGGLALQRWGEPRFTRDIDLTLLCAYGQEAVMAGRLAARFKPRVSDATAFAVENRVLPLSSAGGVPLDIALGAIPFEERSVARATPFDFGGVALHTCSAEDLVVMKAFAGRDRDWADIESVCLRRGSVLDWSQIIEELTPLAALRDPAAIFARLNKFRD